MLVVGPSPSHHSFLSLFLQIPETLFDVVKAPYKKNPNNSVRILSLSLRLCNFWSCNLLDWFLSPICFVVLRCPRPSFSLFSSPLVHSHMPSSSSSLSPFFPSLLSPRLSPSAITRVPSNDSRFPHFYPPNPAPRARLSRRRSCSMTSHSQQRHTT